MTGDRPTAMTDPAPADATEHDAVLARLAMLGDRRAALLAEVDDVTAALRPAVVAAVQAGAVSQARAATVAGVDRMTVREWLGIRRRTAAD